MMTDLPADPTPKSGRRPGRPKGSTKPNAYRARPVSARVTEAQRAEIDAALALEGCTEANLVRDGTVGLARFYIRKHAARADDQEEPKDDVSAE